MGKIAVIGLSGGMDSATLLGYLIEQGFDEIHCCNFQYGSKHNEYEMNAYISLINYYNERGFKLHSHIIDVSASFKSFESNLLKTGGEIPEGHYEAENMKQTVVPGRNMIFASIMAGLAESKGAEVVVLGVHSGDHAIYPDCRASFIYRLNQTIQESSDHKVSVIAPFIDTDKFGILKAGYSYRILTPYYLTRTCYKDQQTSCGKCGSCRERLEAFEKICIADPIEYENR